MEIKISGETIGIVDEYIYLGQLKTSNAKLNDEINKRCNMAWSSFGRLHFIFKSKLPMCLKRKVYNQCVLPVMMYGCETWTLNAQTTQRLRVTQRAMERCMLGITRRDRSDMDSLTNKGRGCNQLCEEAEVEMGRSNS